MDVNIFYLDTENDRHISFSNGLISSMHKFPKYRLDIQHGYSIEDAKKMLNEKIFHAIISHPKLGRENALAFFERAGLDTPVFLIADGKGDNIKTSNINLQMLLDPLCIDYDNLARSVITLHTLSESKRFGAAMRAEMDHKTYLIDLLKRSTKRFQKATTVDQLNESLYSIVKDELPCDDLTISSYDRDKKKLRAEFVIHMNEEVDVAHFPPLDLAEEGQGTQSQVIHSKRSLIINGQRKKGQGPQAYYYNGKKIIKKNGGRSQAKQSNESISTIYAPVILEEEPLGVLFISNHQGSEYTGNHAEILEAIVHHYILAKERVLDLNSLSQVEKRYRSLFEKAPLCYQSLDDKGIILNVNNSWMETLGYERKDCIGKRFDLFLSPLSLKLFKRAFQKFKSQGYIRGLDLELVRKDGEVIPCKFDGSVDYDNMNNALVAQCLFKKINDKGEDDQALMTTQYYIDQADFDIYRLDRDGKFIYVNDHLCKGLGYSREQLMQMFIYDIDPTYTVDQRSGRWGELKGSGVHVFQSMHQNALGGKSPVLVTSQYFNYNDNEFELSFVTDISGLEVKSGEIDKLKAQLGEKNDKLLSVTEELNQVSHAASHDIQEPLRMTISYLQLLKRKHGKNMADEANDYVKMAIGSSHRLQAMINDLMLYSNLGSQGCNYERFNALEALNMAIINLKGEIDRKNAMLKIGRLPEIYADKSMMSLLFQNLLSNSIKFSKKDKTPIISIDASEDGGFHRFTISDKGIGVGEDYRESIFMIFKRLHSIEDYPGSGMGLPICRKIVGNHKGEIWMESQKGEGSSIIFTLPIQR